MLYAEAAFFHIIILAVISINDSRNRADVYYRLNYVMLRGRHNDIEDIKRFNPTSMFMSTC